MKCIFCKIAQGKIPCHKIYEDDFTIAFLDVRPAVKQGGHTLVIPKEHYELITEIPKEIMGKLMETVKKVSKALLHRSEGLNLLQNNKRAAGQAVNHVHFHLIPRYSGDGIEVERWKSYDYKEEEMDKVAKEIKNLLK